jgi:hypothetical protein
MPSRDEYSLFDRPEILNYLFYPRSEWGERPSTEKVRQLLVPVEGDAAIGACLHVAGTSSPTILFFHGNGEVVSDYDDLGPIYTQAGINFFPADYRGYGRSTGSPTVSAMMGDCHAIFDFAKKWLEGNGFNGPFIVMGRSLGSASALELAASRMNGIDGLIIESGFAHALPLLRLLGIDTGRLGLREDPFRHTEKIRKYGGPTLIIHSEYDQIIPYEDGVALYNASGAADRTLLQIPEADHNTIFMYGMKEYIAAVADLARAVS